MIFFMRAAAVIFSVVSACMATARGAEPSAPATITYSLDRPGKVAIAIDDEQGNRVRNLFATVERAAGEHAEPWDGLDDAGRPVAPGTYRYKAAVTPPLGLIYEFTIYNPGKPPWWTVDSGEPRLRPGGWASDHAAPKDVAAVGDVMFIGSPVAESGHSIFAVDLAGEKLWGARWLDLCGASCVASDGRHAYIAGEGGWIGKETRVYRIHPQTFKTKLVMRQSHTTGLGGRGGGLCGLAAREGLVYAAFDGPLTDCTAARIPAAALDSSATTLAGLPANQAAGILGLIEPRQPWITWPLPADTAQPLRIAWNEPQQIGTILSPHALEVAALAADATYPGDPAKDADWVPLQADLSNPAFKVYTAPGGIKTRALRVRVLDAVEPWKVTAAQAPYAAGTDPPKRFAGLRMMEPGFRSVGGTPQVTVSAGEVVAGGGWENVQHADISPNAPAIYTMQLGGRRAIRALAVRDPFFLAAEVEVQRDPGGPWERCGRLQNKFLYREPFGCITADFAKPRSVSGVRIVVTEPAVDQNADVKKRTGQARTTCGLGGVILLGTGPDDPAVPPDLGRRIAVYDGASRRLVREIPVPSLGNLGFGADGRLLAVSDNQVVVLNTDTGETTPLITDHLTEAGDLACSTQGDIFVSDPGEHVVKRFAADGSFIGSVGEPGGLAVGPYDPRHMSRPLGLAFDSTGRLWVAENESYPKKVSVWKLDGPQPALDRFFIGAAPYGGGMTHIDPRQPQRFFFETMEFEVDWTTGKDRIKNILSRGTMYDRPIYVGDRLYLVAEPHGFYTWYHGCMEVALYRDDRAVPVAAAGKAEEWSPLQREDIRAALGNPPLAGRAFVWSDLDADGAPQADEIQLGPEGLKIEYAWGQNVGFDLALQFPNLCLAPVEIRGDGVPIYSFAHTRPTPEAMGDARWLNGHKYHALGLTRDDRIIEVGPVIGVQPRSGGPRWAYPEGNNACYGVNSNKNSPPIAPGVIVGSLEVMGQGSLPNLGDFFAVQTNRGQVYIFTTDGLFVAQLFHDNREGTGGFNFPEAKRGMSVARASLQQEHFGGALSQVDDGRVFLVVGHNHNSVVRVDGLTGIERFAGSVTLGPRATAAPGAAAQTAARAGKELRISRGTASVDGDLSDWQAADFVAIEGNAGHVGRGALRSDGTNLLCAFDVQGRDDLVNGGDEPKMLFRSGDSVDVQLGPDRAADAAPAPGDVRLVITRLQGKPIAVLYRYAVPGTPDDKKHTFASPVGEVKVDAIDVLDTADIAITKRPGGYSVEAAFPWKTFGATPGPQTRLRCDLGILFANESGSGISERVHWSNKETGTVSDVPEEIRLKPHLWGTAIVE